MSTVAFYTLGCKVNTYETEAISNLFEKDGYKRVEFNDNASVYVINTCTVTNTGDKKSRQIIRRAIRQNPDAIIVVMGCYAQLSPKEIQDIEGVDIIVGTQGRENLMDYIHQYEAERQPIMAVTNIMRQKKFEAIGVENFAENTRAFLKIQEGCNNYCTFCIIPYARGKIRSRPVEDVLQQSRKLVENGYKEIVLTGIHTAGYGEDLIDYSFAKLLYALSTEVPGLQRLRISSIEASQIDDDVLAVLRSTKIIVDHLHVPIQAGCDETLTRMRRKYQTNHFEQTMIKLREIFPQLAITTDLIVGFPGEDDNEFETTYNFIKKIGFSELHVFPYSIRNGTVAAKMEQQVPDIIKSARVSQMIALSDQMAKNYAAQFEGQTLGVLVEEVDKENSDYVIGHTTNYLRVRFKGDSSLIGNIYPIKIESSGYPISTGTAI
ncbi:MAG: tRNA (N(6)-L-threonylcarbamoyladenosine(37)-C(2))-methylthiotransferase MtaB [Culicoidibacterales bacterium]